jgi:plasmid stabilization system protein ParE
VIELIWSPQSVADVEEIRAYIAADSKLYAQMTVQRIVAAVERLRMFPDSGRMVPERPSPELREVIAGNFRIVYRRTSAAVEVATVFRGSRELPAISP